MVSVVVPAYNAEKTIERCIRSVLEYPEGQVECIVVNDGSRDGTSAVLEGLIPRFPGLIRVEATHGGVARARNMGLRRCRGEWVMFLDADDTLLPEWFSLYQRYVEGSGADLHIFDARNLVPGRRPFQNGFSAAPGDPVDKGCIYRMMLTSPELNSSCAKFYSRRLLEARPIVFPEGIRIGEDAIFVQRYCMAAERFALHREAIMCYYYNVLGAMRSESLERKLEDGIVLLDHRLHCAQLLGLSAMDTDIYNYHLKTLTALMMDVSRLRDRDARKQAYDRIRGHAYTARILEQVVPRRLSGLKHMEYLLLTRSFPAARVYFGLKGKLRKENSF